MSWIRLTAKKAREEMGRDAEYDFDPMDTTRQVADEFPDTDVLASPPPLRPGNVAADTFQPSAVLEQKEEKLPRPKRQGRGPSKRNLLVSTSLAILEDAESLVPPNGITREVALGVRFSTEEFYPDFPGERVWRTGKLNIRDRCTNVFLKKNWEAWRKLAQPLYVPPKADVRKSFLHYAGLELHGLKVDWSTVDLSIAMNTISKERRHAARRELYRLRARMDGRLVERTDPDAAEKSQKMMKRLASTQDRAPKRPRSEPKPKVSVKNGNLPSAPSVPARVSQPVPIPASVAADTHAGGISKKGKEKVAGSPIVDTLAEEERKTKLAVKASRQDLHVDPTLPTPTGQTSGRGSNQMSAADFTTQVKQDCSNLPYDGQMTQSMSNMASTLTMAMEEHTHVWKFWASLEDQLAQAKKEEEVLKAKISDLEEEKHLMNERVAMMEKKDLYELLEAKMQGYQIANHPGTLGDFENLNLTIMGKWTTIPTLNLDMFEKCPADYPDFAPFAAAKWVGWKDNCPLCVHPLGLLPSINTGMCKHMFHFNCFWKYASTRRICPKCRTALPDSTYEFFCTIFVPEGIESIDPNTGEKEVMEAQVDEDELESGRGRHVLWNDADILTNNESRAFALLEVNKALKLWRSGILLPGVSFVRGHRTLESVECEIDREGIEELYSNIGKSSKTAAESLPNSRAYDELMMNVFDSYVNPNNDPDIRPLVAGLDADDFTMEKLLGTKVPKTPDDVGPDFEESLSEHSRLKLNSELLTMVDGPPRVTRSTRTRLEYEPIVVSASSPTKHVLVEGNSDTLGLLSPLIPICSPAIIPSPSPSIPINLTNVGLDDPFSPPRPAMVDTYDRTSHSEEAMISIARLRRSISPKLRDGDSHGQLPAWIFVPIHGSNHWSLAIIRLHREFCHIVHLDSCVDIHIPTAIFHVLKTFIYLTMKVDVTKIEHQSWPVDQQKDNFSCGLHVLQMLAGAGMRDANLDHCFWRESFNSIATTDNVTSFWLMLGLYLEGKLEVLLT
ncbi:hypothetical protein R1sor_022365 [Riccia sorocarpa]|uniref:Ubiquitin-like protease family profile domain-containing protein n=1 Tax=Riccia sorocarpa TaxID=122646 RepID=A0ABD3GLU9_9MARC